MSVLIPENELIEEPFRPSAGPGGQKVNKTSNGVRLLFRFSESAALSDEVKENVRKLAASRISSDGTLVITAHSYRSLERNREDARSKLSELMEKASHSKKKRRPTKATRASCERRLKAKHVRAEVKNARRKISGSGD